jgi:D-alanine-D-alanine ligase
MGLEDHQGAIEECFRLPIPAGWKKVSRRPPDLEGLKAARKWKSDSLFGKGVLELCRMADIVFLALHGACGEDGRIQATLETLGIPFTGTGFLAAAMAMDKDLTKKLVMPTGVKTPVWEKVTYTSADIPAIARRTLLPVVVKPLASGSSIGVSIVHNEAELTSALEECLPMGGSVVLEQYVKGREIQVGYLVDRALPSIEIIPKGGFYDYRNKYQAGAAVEICPAPVEPEIERMLGATALKVHKLLELQTYSRTDFIITDAGEIYFLEINTLPGMTPTSLVPQEAAAAGIDYNTLCQIIVDDAMGGANV